MTSMRFSRTNPPGVSAYDSEDYGGPQEAQGSRPGGQTGRVVTLRTHGEGESHAGSFDPEGTDGFSRPAWQQYFFLAPNVRFTRTPDSDKRPVAQPDDEAPAKAMP